MHCSVDDGRVTMARSLVACDVALAIAVVGTAPDEDTPPEVPWEIYYARGFVAYTAEQEAEITKALQAGQVAFSIEPFAQPDAERLARVQAAEVGTRTEALAYFAPYWFRCTRHQAAQAAVEYNLAAKGVIAFDEAERDEVGAKLAAIGVPAVATEVEGPPPTIAELEGRIKELEAAGVNPETP